MVHLAGSMQAERTAPRAGCRATPLAANTLQGYGDDMIRLRVFAWLIALVAFIASPFGAMSLAHSALPADQVVADCPDHAPPPDCPAEGTAKHAAGECCPLMAGVVAVLPPVVLAEAPASFHARPTAPASSLAGLAYTQDPPPPRV
jgi:hypothetical protein